MLAKHWLIFIIIISQIICNNETKKITKNVYFNSNTVSFNPQYLQDHSLNTGQDHLSLNIILNVAQNFTYDPWAEIILSSTKRKRPLFTYDINVCTILGKEGSQLNNFVSNWVNNFMKYGNLPKSCPIIKGNYSWASLKADKLNIPPFLPNGKYRVNINTYFRKDTFKESIANLTLLLELK